MKRKLLYLTIFFGILALGAIFRLYGNNWDQNAHLHPDERFLTMVGNAISWPTSFSEYIDPAVSPLNPYNKGYDFFVYGRFPLILVKYIADSFGQGDYNHLNLVGRFVS
ncbi:MAG: putative membrane protein, partial [Candidatus Gottesmanbacteria bacterium GW2011_GWC2_39_8]